LAQLIAATNTTPPPPPDVFPEPAPGVYRLRIAGHVQAARVTKTSRPGAASLPNRRRLARYRVFRISGQVLKNLLLSLLDFEQNRLSHSQVVPRGMDLASL